MTRDDFATLVVGYLGEVTAYARRLTRTVSDADDLVQGTYERAFKRWPALRDPRSCRAWLFAIARNLHLDQGRRTAARRELSLVREEAAEVPGTFVSAEAVERLEARELEAALGKLGPEQREAVLLCDLWGFGYVEIAAITGSPLGTVQSRIARGREALAVLLSGEGAGRGRVRGR